MLVGAASFCQKAIPWNKLGRPPEIACVNSIDGFKKIFVKFSYEMYAKRCDTVLLFRWQFLLAFYLVRSQILLSFKAPWSAFQNNPQ